MLESVGGDGFAGSVAATKLVTGRVIVYGIAAGTAAVTNRDLNFRRQIQLIGLHAEHAPDMYRELIEELFALQAAGVLQPGEPTVFDLADGPRALEQLELGVTVGRLAAAVTAPARRATRANRIPPSRKKGSTSWVRSVASSPGATTAWIVPSPRSERITAAATAIRSTARGAGAGRRSRQATHAARRHSGMATTSITSRTPVMRRPPRPTPEPSAQATWMAANASDHAIAALAEARSLG